MIGTASSPGDASGAHPSHALTVLGVRLAEAREARGWSQEQLAERLHVGTEQLRALERADLSQLPEAVFVVALARRVAHTLDLDVEDAIAALRRMPTPGRAASGRPGPDGAPLPAPSQPAAGNRRRLPSAALLVGLALAALAIALGLVARQITGPIPRAKPAGGGAIGAAPSRRLPAPPQDAAAPAGGTAAELQLSSREPSWVAVRDQAGRVLFQGMLSGEQRFPIGAGLEIRAGRPDLVSAALPGVRSRPLGPIERVIWYRFAPIAPAAGGSPASASGPLRTPQP